MHTQIGFCEYSNGDLRYIQLKIYTTIHYVVDCAKEDGVHN
jgi:hypothetical protein